MSIIKICFKCGEEKPLSEFYKHPRMADGHLNKCKVCCKEDNNKNREKNKEHYKTYEKKRANLPHRVEARLAYSQSEAGRHLASTAKQKYIKRNPKKRKVHNIVNNAIRDGTLIKPPYCEHCGTGSILHGHHCDYNKPLEVIWLCSSCHSKWHLENGEGLNG